MAKLGLGLTYALESLVLDELSNGQLQRVLEPFAPTVPGYCIYFPRPGAALVGVATLRRYSEGTAGAPRKVRAHCARLGETVASSTIRDVGGDWT
jgi:DNA-binding transcriptional LysR family regulator